MAARRPLSRPDSWPTLTAIYFETRDILTAPDILSAPNATRPHRAPNLKIQDGCHNRCSFCIIPFVRGKSRYVGADQIVEQVRALSAKYREVVLSGINLGRWGRESGSTLRLPDLLRRLLDETEIERLRLSSVEPMDFSDDLLGLMAETPRIAKHVHAPLQSGSDAILRRMHRKYRPRHYADRVTKARQLMPDAAIGADVMVGFPGETDELFEESRAVHRRRCRSLICTFSLTRSARERPAADHARRRADARAQRTQSRSARPGGREEPRPSGRPCWGGIHGGDARSARASRSPITTSRPRSICPTRPTGWSACGRAR